MTYLLGCLALAAPRFTIFLLVLFSDYVGNAYETTLVPLLGFFVLPVTTLGYAWAITSGDGSVSGFRLGVVVLAVMIDIGMVGTGHAAWRVQKKRPA